MGAASMGSRPMRRWDSYDAYLFDLDGTLLVCRDAVHYWGFCDVLTRAAGRPLNLDGVVAHGNVDVGILRDALDRAGVVGWRENLPAMREQLCAWVEAHASELEVDALPGAQEVLQHLRARGALLGVATGNLQRIGWAKLRAAGLHGSVDFGVFSDRCECREEVFREAVAEAKQRGAERVCAVGDTPLDVRAARACGIDCIAVATGVYAPQTLEGATRVVGNMEELLSS